METEVTVRVDIDDVYDTLSYNQQVDFVAEKLNAMSSNPFSRVIEQLDKEAVITQFTAQDICDHADEQDLIDELTRRGWKLEED